MCFSAPASFAASAGLFLIGAVAVKKSGTGPQRFFAAIPIIFALQQFSEGFVWLSFSTPSWQPLYSVAIYTYLIFAQVVWPTYVPLSVLLLEQSPQRKRLIRLLLTIGILTSAYLLYCLFAYPTLATVEKHHIRYDLALLRNHKWFNGLPYVLAAVVSPFVSRVKRIWLFGLVLLVSYLVTRVFYQDYIVSVWCYFAALLSIIVLAIILRLRKLRLLINPAAPAELRSYE